MQACRAAGFEPHFVSLTHDQLQEVLAETRKVEADDAGYRDQIARERS